MNKKLGKYILYAGLYILGEIVSFLAYNEIKKYQKENRQTEPSDDIEEK